MRTALRLLLYAALALGLLAIVPGWLVVVAADRALRAVEDEERERLSLSLPAGITFGRDEKKEDPK